jgi:hypothetical protein
MTVNEIDPSPPNNHHAATDISSMVEYPTLSIRNPPVSMIIPMPTDASPVISSIVPTKRKESASDPSEFHGVPTRKRTATKRISASYLRHRLSVREWFLTRL